MAILVEAVSVVIQRARIDEHYPGGWDGFVADCPNGTLCADSDLARIGFMTPVDAESFCRRLEDCGLVFLRNDIAIDFAVVDQIRGPTKECDWLEFGHLEIDGHRIAACRIVGSTDEYVITPDGWKYEESLTASYDLVPTESAEKSLVFLRHDNGLDVFFNRLTGKEVYVGRTGEVPMGNPNNGNSQDQT